MKLVFWFILLPSALTLQAETIYMSQSGSGTGTGLDSSNRASAAFFNNSSNWGAGPGKIGAGDTVSMSGTITTALVLQGSGSAGNVITVLFETNALMTAPFWVTGAIHTNNKSYITIDGGTNGRIQASANGTLLANQTTCVGINVIGGTNVTIQNLIIDDMYVRPAGSSDGTREGQNILVEGSTGNITVNNCTVTDGDTPISYVFDVSGSNYTISNNIIGRCNHGINAGVVTNNITIDNFRIFGNVINDLDVWDGNGGLHTDGMILFNESPAAQAGNYANAGQVTNLRIYSNRIGPNIGFINTAAIFIPDQGGLAFPGVMVYNNLLTFKAGGGYTNGFMQVGSQNSLIANNTCVSLGLHANGTSPGTGVNTGIGQVTTNATIKNNLFIQVGYLINDTAGTLRVSEHNVFAPGIQQAWIASGNGFHYSLAAWRSATGFDTTSVFATPSLDANYVPTAGDTVARNQGENLSAFFTTDINGNTRTGAWDIGAFEFISTAFSSTGISANDTGTQITMTFNSQPSFGLGGQGGFTIAASGGAITASGPTIGTNSISWNTLSRVIGRGESISATYVQPGNGIEETPGGADLASFSSQAVLNNSTIDLTAPIPNPSTFLIVPTATSSSTITMTATTSTDAFSGPVQYFFDETTGNPGGTDSSWQSSPTYVDSGLQAGTLYTYRVQAQDSAPALNTTAASASANATTLSVAGARPATPFNAARANIVTP